MVLRYLSFCDEHGRKSAPVLQYWSDITGWEEIEYVEFKAWERDKANLPPGNWERERAGMAIIE